MNCEKCGDKGFEEQEHGLVMIFCDCDKGKKLEAEITGDVLTLETLRKVKDEAPSMPLSKEETEAMLQPSDYIPPENIETLLLPEDLESALNDPLPHSGSGMGKIMDDLVAEAKVTAHIDGKGTFHLVEVKDDNSGSMDNSGCGSSNGSPERTGRDNQPAGSADTGKPEKPKKRKAKKKAGKRAR